MNILVCDDKSTAVKKIVGLLNEYKRKIGVSAEVFGCADIQKMEQLSFEKYDIFFLDIDMRVLNGIQLARNIRARKKDSVIIFITNYIEYAPDGYEVQAFRYLLKVTIEQKLFAVFCDAVEEYRRLHHTVSFLVEGEYIDVPIKNILYLESEQRIIKVHLIYDRHVFYKFYGNMGNMTQQLEPIGFLRVQKSYLVNMQYIEALQYKKVKLKGEIILNVSEKNYAQIKQEYMAWRAQNRWDII